jgi:hypothetical protein
MELGEGIEVLVDQLFGEYSAELKPVDLIKLRKTVTNHNDLGVRPCHDVYIGMKDKGILTIKRMRKPAFGMRWPIGGGLYRGYSTKESIDLTVERETGLKTTGTAVMLGSARILSNYDRFEKGTGVDSAAWIFYVDGIGELKLDEDHSEPLFTKPEDCTRKFLESLHPYVRDFLPKALKAYERRKIA